MAHTYQNLPPSLSSMLSTVTSRVSDAISSEIGFTVKYKHNGFTALMNELLADSKSPTRKNDRYPLIALIQPFTANVTGTNNGVKVTFDLIICTLTNSTTPADTRETDNYDAILRPIYAEFLSQLRKYHHIHFKGFVPEHSHRDIYHLGDDRGGKNGYIIPDPVDAILIEGMEVVIFPESCINYPIADCVAKHSVRLFNAINTVTLTIQDNSLLVTMTDVDYVNSVGGAAAPVYRLDMGDGTASQVITLNVAIDHSVLNLPNARYIGTITSDYGAIYQFEYYVRGQTVTEYVNMSDLIVDYGTLSCLDYFAYPIEFSYTANGYVSGFLNTSISTISGNDLVSYSYPAGDLDEDITYSTVIDTLPQGWYVNITTAYNNILENKIILTLNTL